MLKSILPWMFLLVLATQLGAAAGRQLTGQHAPATSPALSPSEAQKKFKVPEGFEVRLFASEPDVINPVAMTWDDRGRLWVLELYEYPLGAPKGTKPRDRIKILEDTDLDGRADKVTLFADGLNLGTGLLLGQGGAYVGQAPHLLFLKDENGDDQADVKWTAEKPFEQAVVLTGFGLHDRHELLNGFTWGPDGQLYLTHGVFTHSKVRKLEDPEDDGVIMDAAVARIDLRKKKFEVFADGTSNPWGVDFDRAGNMFVSACVIDHMFQMAGAAHYTRQGGRPPNPYGYELLPSIVDHKHFRAAYAGLQIYQGHQFPREYQDTVFMGNIHASAVHLDRLTPRGSTFVASADQDFLVANDGWFRPVSTQVGPDGAIWVMDWYDKYPCYQNANADPEGVDRVHGRIWRVVHTAGKTGVAVPPHPRGMHLGKLSTPELVALLNHSNSWHRRMAQRLLSERRDPAARAPLVDLFSKSERSETRVAAFWTLFGSDQLDEALLDQAAGASDPILRLWSARFTGEKAASSAQSGLARLQRLAADADHPVRLGVATAARQFVSSSLTVNTPVEASLKKLDTFPLLTTLLKQGAAGNDLVLPFVTWMASEPRVLEHLDRWLGWIEKEARASSKMDLLQARKIMRRVSDSRDGALLSRVVGFLENFNGQPALVVASLDGLIDAQKGNAYPPSRSPSTFLTRLSSSREAEIVERAQRLGTLWGDATATQETIRTIENRAATSDQRLQAIRTGRQLKNPAMRDALLKLVRSETNETLVVEGLRGLSEIGGDGIDIAITGLWKQFSAGSKRAAAEALSSRIPWSRTLLSAVEKKEISAAEIPATVVRTLAQSGDATIKRRSQELIGKFRESDQDKLRLIAAKKAVVLNGPVDFKAGLEVARKACLVCHKLHGEGADVGPDLTGVGRSSIEALLANIIDPNQVIGKGYENVVIDTKDGRTISGRLVEENDSRVRLLASGPKEEIIAKDQIAERVVSEMSVMPENLEQMPDADFRNMVWYIFNPPQDRKPLTIEPVEKGLKLKAQLSTKAQPVEWLHYVMDPQLRPYFHPVRDPEGAVVLTEDRPSDHLWQHGIFTGLHQVNGIDFWTERQGKQRFVRLLDVQQELDRASWRSLSEWVAPAGEVVLEEEQGITVYPSSSPDFYLFDFEWLLRAREKPVKIGRHDYGGLSVRMITDPRRTHLNSTGEKNQATANKRAAWVNVSRPFGVNTFGIAILDHPQNAGHPATWRVDEQGLINPSPSLQGDWSIEAGKEKIFRYRIVVHRGAGQADQLSQEHQRFSALKEVAEAVPSKKHGVDGESVALWNPLWRVMAPDFEGTPIKLHEFAGRKNVLMTHPFEPGKAAALERIIELPAGERNQLRALVAAHEQGNWELRIKVDDQIVHRRLIDGKGDRWKEVLLDLSSFAGKKIVLRLENYPNDWSYEFGYWGEISLNPAGLAKGN